MYFYFIQVSEIVLSHLTELRAEGTLLVAGNVTHFTLFRTPGMGRTACCYIPTLATQCLMECQNDIWGADNL